MRALIGFGLFAFSCIVQAQLYRWVDESGKVHYTDTRPPANAKNVQRKSLASGPGDSVQLPYAVAQAVRNFPVTIYTSPGCGEACTQARDLLTKRGVPHKEVSVTDGQSLEQFKKVSGGTAAGGSTVPVTTVGRDVVLKGFESTSYHAALDAAGYPKTSLLPSGLKAGQVVKPDAKVDAKTVSAEPKPTGTEEQAPQPASETGTAK